jgi:hypothetical protein
MYKYPDSRNGNLRLFILWLIFLLFIVVGITLGVTLGLVLFAGFVLLLRISITEFTVVHVLVVLPFLLIGLGIGVYALCLLWMLCVRPFFSGKEVRSIVFFGPTWPPERWLFQKLYPGISMYDED